MFGVLPQKFICVMDNGSISTIDQMTKTILVTAQNKFQSLHEFFRKCPKIGCQIYLLGKFLVATWKFLII
jgi:hypothetical protein